MDTTANNIKFDKNNYCNYCSDFLKKYPPNKTKKKVFRDKSLLLKLVNECKKNGHGKKYDCIIGLSGGIDSSWTLIEVKRLGLRPLAVHFDNGWNAELAQNNIFNLIDKLDVDLHTHVCDWEEYRSLMQSFFDADVLDLEVLNDNGMLATNYMQAKKNNLKYILTGTNTSTEGIKIPNNWVWLKYDKKIIKSLGKLNNVKVKTLPLVGVLDIIYYEKIRNIKWISFLDYIEYDKDMALQELIKNYNYKPYPYKHYENIFTRFHQGYILPKKFGIDKRKLHLSNLIITNSLTRDEALEMIKESPYPSKIDLNNDTEYFLKKMNWTQKNLDSYISRPFVKNDIYPSEINLYRKIKKITSSKYLFWLRKLLKNKFQ